MEFDLAQTDTLLSTTRAVRKRLDFGRDVPDGVLLDCLQLAVQAPTGSNRQGWRWLVVRDPAKKQALADLYRKAGGSYLKSAAANPDLDAQMSRVMSSSAYLAENMHRAPVLVVPLITGRIDDGTFGSAAAMYGSIMPAVWSFQLALRSRGLGSVLTTIHLRFEREAAELLAIPAHLSQAALLPVAYTIGTDFKPAARGDVADITYLDSYDTPIRS